MRRSLMIAGFAGLAAACSFFVPFSEYDKETNAPDAAEAGDGPDVSDASDASDAGEGCDADLQIDDNNCGACGHKCLTNSGCTGGLCETVPILGASDLYLVSVKSDDAGVYFGGVVATKTGSAGVLGVYVNASSVTPIAFMTAPPVHIALTADEVYWTQGLYVDAGPTDRGVSHTPKIPAVDGGGFVAPYVTGVQAPFAITVDPSGVYFTDPVLGGVWTAALRAPANDRALVTDPSATGLAADAVSVFWSTPLPSGRVMRAGKDGSNPQPIATSQAFPNGVAVDDDYVYWTSYDPDGAIYRAPKTGGTPLQIARGQNRPAVIALDDTYVYWGNIGPDNANFGSIMRAPKAGGRTLVLSVGQKPIDLTVDGRYVYWPSGGIIYQVAK